VPPPRNTAAPVGDRGQDATTELARIVAHDQGPQAQRATAAATVSDLAGEFLADTAGDRRPWPALFTAWAAEHGLSESEARSVKVQVLRLRVFGAVERHRPRETRPRRRR